MSTKKKSNKKKSNKKNSKKKSNKRMVSRKTKSIYVSRTEYNTKNNYKLFKNDSENNYIAVHSDGTKDVYKIYQIEKNKYSNYIYEQPAIVSIIENDSYIQYTLKKGYYYEKHLIMIAAQFLKPGDVVLDIGTNVGCVTIPLSKIVGNKGRIHSFEPFLKTRISLEYNIKVNNLKNVTLHKEAVGHTLMKTSLANKTTEFTLVEAKYVKHVPIGKNITINGKKYIEEKRQLDTKSKNNYGAVQLGKGGPMVEMITIDSLNLKRVDLIKVDIEGSEPLMFYGASNTIRTYKPIIIFEHNHLKLNDDMIEIMKPSIDVQNFNIVQFCKTLGYNKIIEIETGGNYVLLPEGKERTLNDPRVNWERVDDLPKIKNFGLDGLELFKYIKNEKW